MTYYNDVFLDREFPARKSRKLDESDSVVRDGIRFIKGQNERLRTETVKNAREIRGLRSEAVKSAGEIRALEDRLNSIASLARHALGANPRDLPETWMRVEQIAHGGR